MSIMSGLNLNVVGDIPRQSTGIDNEKLTSEKSRATEYTQAERESNKASAGDIGDVGEGGDGSEYDKSGSVTVTELSGEEEIEEDIDDSEEDTMFEETLTQSGRTLYDLSTISAYMYNIILALISKMH